MAKPFVAVSDGPLAERDLAAIESRLARMVKLKVLTVVLSVAEAAAMLAEIRRLQAKEGKE